MIHYAKTLVAIALMLLSTSLIASRTDSIAPDSVTISVEQLRTYAKYKASMLEYRDVTSELNAYIDDLKQTSDSLYSEVMRIRKVYREQIDTLHSIYRNEVQLRKEAELVTAYLQDAKDKQAATIRKRNWLFAGVGTATGFLIGFLIAR